MTLKDSTRVPGILNAYVKDDPVFQCPDLPASLPVSCLYNDLAGGARISDVRQVDRTVLLMDGIGILRNAGHALVDANDDRTAFASWTGDGRIRIDRTAGVTEVILTRHDGGANYGFADGHAKRMKPGDVFFPPRTSESPAHRDAKTGALLGPDPGGTMMFGDHAYQATFHLR